MVKGKGCLDGEGKVGLDREGKRGLDREGKKGLDWGGGGGGGTIRWEGYRMNYENGGRDGKGISLVKSSNGGK